MLFSRLVSIGNATVAKPGDRIAMRGVDVRVVTSAGGIINTPLPGAGDANPYCSSFKDNPGYAEVPRSVGIHVTFRSFRTMHPGDLTQSIHENLFAQPLKSGWSLR